MGKYTRKCSNGVNGAGEVAVMEVRAVAVEVEVEVDADNSGSVKRRRVGDGKLRLSSSKLVQIGTRDGEDVITSSENFVYSSEDEDYGDPCGDAKSRSSGDAPASCCSSNGSIKEKLKYSDLEVRAEIETDVRNNLDRRESTPTSEFKEESGELESNTAKPSAMINSRSAIPPEKTPPVAELEEFFAAAEKNLHMRFQEKYNYDIVKDVPLKGRFEWAQLEP